MFALRPTLAVLTTVLALAATTACQERDKSYDAINGPENVYQAPLFSTDNRQLDSTNLALYRNAVQDSAFYDDNVNPEAKLEKHMQVADSLKAEAKDAGMTH